MRRSSLCLALLFISACSSIEQNVELDRTFEVVDAESGEPLVGVIAGVQSWFHSAPVIRQGDLIDPRCCRVDDPGQIRTDSRGIVAVSGARFRRDTITFRVAPPGYLPGLVWFERGRVVAIHIGEKEYSGRALDKLLDPSDRWSKEILLRMEKTNHK